MTAQTHHIETETEASPRKNSFDTPARVYDKGMGQAVANRTINRKITRPAQRLEKIELPRKDDVALDAEVAAYCKSSNLLIESYHVDAGDGETVGITLKVSGDIQVEDWADVAERVSVGNMTLGPELTKALTGDAEDYNLEFSTLHHHMRQASILMSGRHLQHGDENQASRNGEVFTNCSSSCMSFLSFYLLLNGSGVGRSYDDALMLVDYNKMPVVVPVIDMSHPDSSSGEITALDLRSAKHLYAGRNIVVHEVADSREGWAKAGEVIESMTFQGDQRETVLIIDFTGVRHRGSPIAGMQGRPASGPGPLMTALRNLAAIRDANMQPWRATMYADNYYAECVLVGGARRAARMATKTWRDKSVLDFIEVKRGGFLWTSNNSVMVDREFWKLVNATDADMAWETEEKFALRDHAKAVFDALCYAAYHDQTGEPGIINGDMLTNNSDNIESMFDGNFAESSRYQLDGQTLQLTSALVAAWRQMKCSMIVNPCVPFETQILTDQGYTAIGDVVGEEVSVWNGNQFSKVTPFHTGFNPTLRVHLSDGTSLRCTPTHKWVLSGGRNSTEGSRVAAQDLVVGDKLAKYSMPVILDGVDYGSDMAGYSQGFYSGDGNTDMKKSWLYSAKYCCEPRLLGYFGEEQAASARKTWVHGDMLGKAWVPVDGSAAYCLSWLAGILDSDGTVCTDREGGQSYQITSIDEAFLKQVRLMLSRLGVQASISMSREAGVKSMPDGKGGMADFICQNVYRIVICGFDSWTLKELGLTTLRLQYNPKKPNRSARRFIKVVAVTPDAPCDTYCFTEPLNHTGTFEGIVTGQCGEVPLAVIGAYCTIGTTAPYFSQNDNDAVDAFKAITRALIRTNTMEFLYGKEVKRTNRIAVGMLGLHEYAWARFGYGWKDIVNEAKSLDFWLMLSRFKRAVQSEAKAYATKLGVTVPHTDTMMAPGGTIGKLFALTEGAHLPPMREYLRWVQFRNDDPLIEDYRSKGYPVRLLRKYAGTTIVGFPTQPLICSLGMGDKLVTAAEATPEEQYEYLRLLEKYYMTGVEEDGVTPLRETGGQVSYTLKYDPAVVSFEEFKRTLLDGQAKVRCCSVMPQADTSAYEYQPEQSTSRLQYEQLCKAIEESEGTAIAEDIGLEHVDCAGSACPISWGENVAA